MAHGYVMLISHLLTFTSCKFIFPFFFDKFSNIKSIHIFKSNVIDLRWWNHSRPKPPVEIKNDRENLLLKDVQKKIILFLLEKHVVGTHSMRCAFAMLLSVMGHFYLCLI